MLKSAPLSRRALHRRVGWDVELRLFARLHVGAKMFLLARNIEILVILRPSRFGIPYSVWRPGNEAAPVAIRETDIVLVGDAMDKECPS